ncbi:unnamed protein product, partial [Brachionus calyciflorus]
EIYGKRVTFENGDEDEFDCIILCTGYKIDLNYLADEVKKEIFADSEETMLNLFKQVFSPKIGKSVGFLGFIQPSSGGLLTVSEMQARWHVRLMLNHVKLPSEPEMIEHIKIDQEKTSKRFHNSKRHTIQQDPIKYNDEIGEFFGVKPNFLQNFKIMWRLLFSSCGPAQWRLNGPDSDRDAINRITMVPKATRGKKEGKSNPQKLPLIKNKKVKKTKKKTVDCITLKINDQQQNPGLKEDNLFNSYIHYPVEDIVGMDLDELRKGAIISVPYSQNGNNYNSISCTVFDTSVEPVENPGMMILLLIGVKKTKKKFMRIQMKTVLMMMETLMMNYSLDKHQLIMKELAAKTISFQSQLFESQNKNLTLLEAVLNKSNPKIENSSTPSSSSSEEMMKMMNFIKPLEIPFFH